MKMFESLLATIARVYLLAHSAGPSPMTKDNVKGISNSKVQQCTPCLVANYMHLYDMI